VTSLGLADVAPFDIQKKVLGLPSFAANALVKRTVHDLVDEVSRDSPAPGGGSVAALAGALGAALASMVANLTHGKEGTEDRDEELARIADEAQRIKDELVTAVDADSEAFGAFMSAMRLPQTTPEEKARRTAKMQEGLKIAIEVPLATATLSRDAMRLAQRVAAIGNANCLSDGAVGVQIAFAGVRGGLWNVLINLKDIRDAAYVADKRAACATLLAEARAIETETGASIDARLFALIDAKH
jgi:glutamate formiminotransferase/formiminotetrahydrofolate cyclodeaminase